MDHHYAKDLKAITKFKIKIDKQNKKFTPFENTIFVAVLMCFPQNSILGHSFLTLTPHVFKQYSSLNASLYEITGNMSVTPFVS